jgi:hypothetical protein
VEEELIPTEIETICYIFSKHLLVPVSVSVSVEVADPVPVEEDSVPEDADGTSPVEEDDSVPVTEEDSVSVDSEGTAPVEEKNLVSVDADGTSPVEEDDSVPVDSDGTAPVEEDESVPVADEDSVPVDAEGTAPVEEEDSVPVDGATIEFPRDLHASAVLAVSFALMFSIEQVENCLAATMFTSFIMKLTFSVFAGGRVLSRSTRHPREPLGSLV